MEELLNEGQSIEFFLEGTRSRSGKMLHPKIGMLSIITSAFLEGRLKDVTIVPININYEKTMEVCLSFPFSLSPSSSFSFPPPFPFVLFLVSFLLLSSFVLFSFSRVVCTLLNFWAKTKSKNRYNLSFLLLPS
jgi:hypothetical protein